MPTYEKVTRLEGYKWNARTRFVEMERGGFSARWSVPFDDLVPDEIKNGSLPGIFEIIVRFTPEEEKETP